MEPLLHHRLGGEKPGPRVLITAGVHGDEFEPMVAVRRLIGLLRAEPLRGTVVLVPVVNELAFRLGRRTGPDGLDLARTCPGGPDGSDTERIAHQVSALIRAANFYIDLHTGGTALALLPLAGYTLHPDATVLARQRRMARVFGLPLVWGTDPSLEGRTLSVARDAGVPAIYVEHGGGGGYDPAGVAACVQGCRNVLVDLGVLDGPPVSEKQEVLVVEDQRQGSGHLQSQHPAPCAGFFEPAVTLGQPVAAGSLLGTVTDVLGDRVCPVEAMNPGFVLALRRFPRVEAGDCLGVILDRSAAGA